MAMRLRCIFGSLVCVIFGVYFYYGSALLAFAYAKWQFRNSREIWMVPQPLSPDSLRRPTGPTLTYFGYEFQSPTGEVKEERKFDSSVALNFSECAGVVMFKPAAAGDLIGVMRQEASKKGRTIENVFGKEATRSSYAIRSKVLNLTPGDLHLFSSRQEMAGNTVLLMLKGAESQRFKNGLYSFQTPWMRGFQEGDLMRDKGLVIEAFDNQDRRLTLIVGAKPGKSCFAQPELDSLISSLRPTPAN